jgi:Ring finger domain
VLAHSVACSVGAPVRPHTPRSIRLPKCRALRMHSYECCSCALLSRMVRWCIAALCGWCTFRPMNEHRRAARVQPVQHQHVTVTHHRVQSDQDEITSLEPFATSPSQRSKAKARLESSFLFQGDRDECPICFDGFDADNPRLVLRCSHAYHLQCVLQWGERSQSCPICGAHIRHEDFGFNISS